MTAVQWSTVHTFSVVKLPKNSMKVPMINIASGKMIITEIKKGRTLQVTQRQGPSGKIRAM